MHYFRSSIRQVYLDEGRNLGADLDGSLSQFTQTSASDFSDTKVEKAIYDMDS